MKEIFKTFLSLTILIVISTLIYLAWIINKGEFTSQYLEKFINDRFKSEKFYTSIQDPIIKFDKKKKKIIVDGKNFNIFSIEKKKILEFKKLKFNLDGRNKETYFSRNKWHDSLYFGILSKNFYKKNKKKMNIGKRS